jgi:hypothetical protein
LALVNNGCFDFRPKSDENRNENQRKPLRSPDAISVLVGSETPILQDREQIHENDRGNAANGLQPTRCPGMRFKPLQGRRERAPDPCDPVHTS